MTVPNNADEIRSMMKVGRREERKKEAELWPGLDLRRARAGQGVAGLGCFWDAGPVMIRRASGASLWRAGMMHEPCGREGSRWAR
jgi:hypothetical protein